QAATSTLFPYTTLFRSLTGQKVTALAVDGGNRKWVGTEQGVWLFGTEGENLIHYFNRDNSPMPSNRVLDIAIDDETGEVFIATRSEEHTSELQSRENLV